MTPRAVAILAGLLLLAACADEDGGDTAELLLDCQAEPEDGCLTLRTPVSKGPPRAYVHFATDEGEPLRQYGLFTTGPFGRGDIFTRPVKPGDYVVSMFRGNYRDFSDTTWMQERECGREFRVRTGRALDFKVVWEGPNRCTIERR
jgi:hypothetical protein